MRWAERTLKLWDEAKADDQLRREVSSNRTLVNWLCRRKWNVFWTQTYRERSSENAARSRLLYFLADSKWSSILSEVFYAIEPHKNIPSYHVHALLSMKSRNTSADYKTPLQRWSQDWRHLKNSAWEKMGKALILPVSEADGAVWYVAKYVTKKDKNIWWREAMRRPPTPEKLWGIETAPLPRQECPRSQGQKLIDGQEVADYDSVVEYFESKGKR